VREGLECAPFQFPIGGKAREGWSEALDPAHGVRKSGPASKRIAQVAGAISGQSEEGLQAPGSGETPEPTVKSGWEKVRTETGLRSGCAFTGMGG